MLKHVNVVTDGINYEVGAMAFSGPCWLSLEQRRWKRGIRQDKRGVLRTADAVPQLMMFMDSMGKLFS